MTARKILEHALTPSLSRSRGRQLVLVGGASAPTSVQHRLPVAAEAAPTSEE